MFKQSAVSSSTLYSGVASAISRFSNGVQSYPQLTHTQRAAVVAKSMSLDEDDPVASPTMNEFSEDDNILHLDQFNWDRVLEESKKQTVIVDIWALWCKSCGKASDSFYHAADANRDQPITFIKFDVEKNKEVCDLLKLKALPNIRIIKDGKFELDKGWEIRGSSIRMKTKLEKLIFKAQSL